MTRNYADIFRDHSLTAASLRQKRLATTIERIKKKAKDLHETQIATERKVSLINEYSAQHGITVRAKERIKMIRFMQITEVQMLLERKQIRRKEQMAAAKI